MVDTACVVAVPHGVDGCLAGVCQPGDRTGKGMHEVMGCVKGKMLIVRGRCLALQQCCANFSAPGNGRCSLVSY